MAGKERIMSRTSKGLCVAGSLLLLVMAVFHGSGTGYVTGLIEASDAPSFLKDIVPALFVHPSLHLIGLASFGLLAIYLGEAAGKVLMLLAGLVLVDSVLGFWLGGIVPGGLLFVAGVLYVVAGWRQNAASAQGRD